MLFEGFFFLISAYFSKILNIGVVYFRGKTLNTFTFFMTYLFKTLKIIKKSIQIYLTRTER